MITIKAMPVRRPQILLALGVILAAGSVLAFEPGPTTESRQLDKRNNQRIDELSAPRCNADSFAPIVRKVAPAVVRIVAAGTMSRLADLAGKLEPEDPSSGSYLWQTPPKGLRLSQGSVLGSGVIVTDDGYILTNTHVVDGAKEVSVTLQDAREFKARLVGADCKSGIAVIKIDAHGLPTIPLAESQNVQVGDLVLAIGNPFGVGQTVTHGIVSAINRGGMGIQDYEDFIQTDAPINPGNSGGALVDATGRLVGINTAILSRSGGNLGIGFAIPSNLANRVMKDLVNYGYVVRGYLGAEAQDLTPELAKEFDSHPSTGALVSGVVPNGPARKAGLEVGDVITGFDGRPVRDARQLQMLVADAKPGHTVPVEVLRNGSTNSLRATVSQARDTESLINDPQFEQTDPGAITGVTISELNNQLRQQLKIPRHVQGALVLDINPFSAAAEAGLRPGNVIQSINRHDVKSVEEASRWTQYRKDKPLLLWVWSITGNHFILLNETQSGYPMLGQHRQ